MLVAGSVSDSYLLGRGQPAETAMSSSDYVPVAAR